MLWWIDAISAAIEPNMTKQREAIVVIEVQMSNESWGEPHNIAEVSAHCYRDLNFPICFILYSVPVKKVTKAEVWFGT